LNLELLNMAWPEKHPKCLDLELLNVAWPEKHPKCLDENDTLLDGRFCREMRLRQGARAARDIRNRVPGLSYEYYRVTPALVKVR